MDSYCSAMNEKPNYKMTSFRFSGRFVEFLKSASRLTRLSQAKLIEKCVEMNLDKVLEELGREALAERVRLEKLRPPAAKPTRPARDTLKADG